MPRARLSAQQKAVRKGAKTAQYTGGRRVLYEIHPGPQQLFMMTTAEEVLYGGAAGGGKSYALRAWGVDYCMRYPGAKIVLFRRSYRELEDTHIIKIQQELPSFVATYSSGNHNLIFNNGSIMMFRFCEKENDVRTYDTDEFEAILIDELTAFTEFQYLYLLSRCRSTNSWWPGRRIRCAATPLDVGHAWVKARFIDSGLPNEVHKAPLDEGGYTRQFIPAKVTDNYTLMKQSPEYIDTLMGLPEEEKRAKLYGDWSVFTGKFFQSWDDNVHVVEPFDIPADWSRWLGVDYGYNAPYAALWVARPPGANMVWYYREQYGAGVDSKTQVDRAWSVTCDAAEKLRGVVLDPSMFSKINVRGERVRPISDDWQDVFGGVTTVYRGNNERIAGWKLMRSLLKWEKGLDGRAIVPPQAFFFRSCTNLVRTLPLLVIDKNNVEDVDTNCEDHAPDTARYLARHIFEGSARQGASRSYHMTPSGIVVRRPGLLVGV